MRSDGIEDYYPLSPMQEGMLFHSLYTPDSGVYVTQVRFTLAGELDPDLFAQSWLLLLRRHTILRTFFVWEGLEAPVQMVQDEVDLPFIYQDWAGKENLETELEAFLHADRHSGFDLSEPPLMRLALLRLSRAEHVVIWSFHHLLLDGWSVTVLLKEAALVYEAVRQGREPSLAPSRPYRDFILWLQRQDMQAAESHWQQALAGFAEPTPFLLEAPHSAEVPPPTGHLRAAIPELSTESLALFGRRHGLTLSTLLQGAWALLLSRYSGSPDVAFGMAVSGRQIDLPSVESMVGLFLNTLLVRAGVDPDACLVPWLQELQAGWAKSLAFEHSPLVQVQGWSEVPRGVPLFESVLVLGNFMARRDGHERASRARGGTLRDVQTFNQTNVALNLEVAPGAELMLELRFDAHRFSTGDMTRMAGHLCQILESFPAKQDVRLEEVPWLTGAELRQILCDAAGPVVPGGGEVFAHSRFQAWAGRAPDACAVEWEGGSRTYRELDRCSNGLAWELARRGVGADGIVVLLGERGWDMLTAILAVHKAGGAYLPLDRRQPAERLARILEQCRVRWILVARDLRPRLEAAAALLPPGDPPDILPLEGWATEEASGPPVQYLPESLAYVLYTSGSTGMPKGVMVKHGGMVNHLLAKIRALGLGREDCVAQTAPLTFDISVWQTLAALLVGGRVRILSDSAVADPRRLFTEIDASRVSVLQTVPSLLRSCVEELEWARPRPLLPSLRWHLVTGEELPAGTSRRWLRLFPRAALVNAYGPTECSDSVAHHVVASPPAGEEGSVRIGRPLDNLSLYVLDPLLRPLPAGVPGELFAGGVGVGRGYLKDPARTAESFCPDPFGSEPGGRLYRTGDRVRRLENGELRFLRRLGRQLKIRGFRIEPGEIEAALRSHPQVVEAVVLAREGATADRRLIAYVVPEKSSRPAPEDLHAHLTSKLADYMVPSAYVVLEAFPINSNGKIDRKALPPTPEDWREERDAYVAPRDATEAVLVEIWEEVLSTRPIGVRDSFFRLGGHSLLAIRIMGLISRRLDQDLPLAALVESGTIENLARVLRLGGAGPTWSPLVRIQPLGTRPPFFCVHPIGGQVLCYADLARCLGPDQPFHGLQAIRLDEVGETAPSIEELAARHLLAVREVQPEGPYLLGGWSMGGVLAFEMARQLDGLGEEVGLVVILDAWSPAVHRVVPDDAYLLYEIVRDQVQQKGWSLPFSEEDLRALEADERLRIVLDHGKRAGLAAGEADIAWLRRFLLGYRARRQSLQRYQPSPYNGRLILVRAHESDPEFSSLVESELGIDIDDPTLGWSAYSSLPVDVRLVAGNHSSMCLEPQVRSLAECLRSLFEEARPPAPEGADPGAPHTALPRSALAASPGSESI